MILRIVYDGECLFCRNFIKLQELREDFEDVELIDARDPNNESVKALIEKKFKLNDGMAIIYGNEIYYGAHAVNYLSKVNKKTFFGIIMRFLFSSKIVAVPVYKVLVILRKLYLRIVGFDDLPY
jgi:predicted DCC family thiol-disulfide oxidoreductase YuxK